jgi:glycosyltransferase involved in cell wall biosynthesis
MRDVLAGAHATIYGSWVEGFGLPVLESLWQGLPCICHNGSALAEIAPGGGTIMADMLDENEIARAIELVATDPVLCDKLADQAISRPLRTWTDYASDIMQVLRNVDAILEYDPLY